MIRLIILLISIIFAFKKFHDAKIGVKSTQNKKNGNARLATPLHFHLVYLMNEIRMTVEQPLLWLAHF